MRIVAFVALLAAGVVAGHCPAEEPADTRTYWAYEGGWFAKSNCSVLAQVGTVRRVGRTGENVPDPLRPSAGDPSRHLGSDGDAGHRCRAGAPVPGDFP